MLSKVIKRKINILFLIDTIYKGRGGTEKQLINIMNKINRDEFRIHLCVLRAGEYISKNQNMRATLILDCNGVLRFGTVRAIKRLCSYITSNKINVLQTFWNDSIYIGAIAARICKIPIIVSRRDMGYWRTKKDFLALKIFNKMIDYIVVNAEAIGREVIATENVDQKKIKIIYNGIDADLDVKAGKMSKLREELNLKNIKVVGFIGNLRPVKGIDTLLLGLKELSQVYHQNYKMIFVGGGTHTEEYKRMSQDFGISQNILFVGSQEDVVHYLKLFDIGILCSKSEGLSNAIMEYMAAGIPVVATDVGGNPELVDESNGVLIEVGDSRGLSNALNDLLSDGPKRLMMGQNSLNKIMRSYLWEGIIPQYEQLYRDVYQLKDIK